MIDDDLPAIVASNYLALADLLDPLPRARWDTPSLCDGWTPPGGGYHGALNHVVIHGLDITVPLREPRRASDTAIRYVLDDLTIKIDLRGFL